MKMISIFGIKTKKSSVKHKFSTKLKAKKSKHILTFLNVFLLLSTET